MIRERAYTRGEINFVGSIEKLSRASANLFLPLDERISFNDADARFPFQAARHLAGSSPGKMEERYFLKRGYKRVFFRTMRAVRTIGDAAFIAAWLVKGEKCRPYLARLTGERIRRYILIKYLAGNDEDRSPSLRSPFSAILSPRVPPLFTYHIYNIHKI